jgi:hypothetical protein
VAPPPPGGQTTLGYTSIGASQTQGLTANWKVASLASLSNQLVVNRIRWYLRGGAAAQACRAMLYANTSFNEPGTLIASSDETLIAAGRAAGWVDFPIAAQTLQAGAYWIALSYGETSGSIVLYFTDAVGQERYNTDTFADGPSDPFGTASGPAATLSAYADFVVATDAPVALSAAGNASTVRVLFSRTLDPASVPDVTSFQLARSGVVETPTAVTIQGGEVDLTLGAPLLPTQTLSLVYTPPLTGALVDSSGVPAPAFALSVVNNAGRLIGAGRTTAVARIINPAARIAGRGGGGI